MSPKKTILRTLSEHEVNTGPGTPIRPAAIPGFRNSPEKFQKTINLLLKDRLIEGVRDPEGHLAISLNSQRQKDVKRALRPAWAHPGFLALATILIAAASFSLLS